MPQRRLIDVMRENPAYCFPWQSLQDAAELMEEETCSELPVVDSEGQRKPVGLLTARDIVVRSIALGRSPFDLLVADCMTEPAITMSEEATLGECVETMRDQEVHHIVVINDQGGLCGVLSFKDIAKRTTEQIERALGSGEFVRAHVH